MQNIPVRGRLEGRQPSFVTCLQVTTWAFADSLCLKRRSLVHKRSPRYPEQEYFAHSGEKNDNMTLRRKQGKTLSRIVGFQSTMELFGSGVMQPAPALKLRPGKRRSHAQLERAGWLRAEENRGFAPEKNPGTSQKGSKYGGPGSQPNQCRLAERRNRIIGRTDWNKPPSPVPKSTSPLEHKGEAWKLPAKEVVWYQHRERWFSCRRDRVRKHAGQAWNRNRSPDLYRFLGHAC